MTELVPKELLQWLDLPLAIMLVIVCQVLRTWVEPPGPDKAGWREAFRGDRILMLPLVLGLVVGALIESTTPTWNLNVLIRRTLALAGGSALAFKAGRTLLPGWFASTETKAG